MSKREGERFVRNPGAFEREAASVRDAPGADVLLPALRRAIRVYGIAEPLLGVGEEGVTVDWPMPPWRIAGEMEGDALDLVAVHEDARRPEFRTIKVSREPTISAMKASAELAMFLTYDATSPQNAE